MARVIVKGYRETDRAFRKMSKELTAEWRNEMKEAAEPIAADARSRLGRYQGASLTTIRPVALAKGVVVRQHKSKVTGKRGDFGSLQMSQGLIPALESKREAVIKGVENALDRLTREAGF